jgi:signal transduction histidine kinase
MKAARPAESTQVLVDTNIGRRPLRDVLSEIARGTDDVKALDLYATALEIGSIDTAPAHRVIATMLAQQWPRFWSRDQRTLEEAKLNLVRRLGEAARAMAERARRHPPAAGAGPGPAHAAQPAYFQLYCIGRSEPSYPVRLAAAQEVGAGGDHAFAVLEDRLGPELAERRPGLSGGGDIAGILTVAPPLLLCATRRWNHRPGVARVLEAGALAATLALLAVVALAIPAAGTFLVFPALAWAAVRFRQVGAATAGLFIAAVVVWATARGQGPFAGSSLTQGLLLSQAFAGVLIATGLFLLAALTAERDQATRLLDATFERLPVGLVLLNPDLTLRRGSRNAEQLLGVQLTPGLAARTLVRRLQMTDLAGRPWLAEGTRMLAATRRSDGSHGEVAITRYATGEPVRLEYWAVPVRDNGRLAALALLFHDVTELRRAEADRERLLGRLLRLQQDERRQLAVGLQREVVHGLAVTLTRLDGIQERLPDGDDRTRRSLGRAGEALNHSLQATRRLIFGLRPPLLDTQGLVAAINQQLSKVTVETGVQTDLRWRGHERLDAALEATAFRAVQEALANVIQHANPSRLLVTGHVADGLLAVEVIDDGTGFTPDTQQQAPGDGHLGMRTMSEWVQLAGGSLQVRSAPAAGTIVSINLPIRPQP